jgi:phosphatidylglycerophosphatase A
MTRNNWAWWVATVGGIGLIPLMPGTAGSAVGLLTVWGLEALTGPWGVAAALAVLTPVGIAASAKVAARLGRSDPSVVVIDEVCGMLVTLAALPLTPLTAAAGFLFFRAFDIFKPFPISWVERRWHGGWGIVADDLVAGLAANLCLRGLLAWWT